MRRVLLWTALGGLVLAAACGSDPVGVVGGCAEPAPLHGERSPAAPGYFVALREGVDAHRTAWELAQRHRFTPQSIIAFGFTADFPDATREALRCEPVVRYVEHAVEPAPPPGAP